MVRARAATRDAHAGEGRADRREFQEMTQTELAAASGAPQPAIAGIESGRIAGGGDRAEKLARRSRFHPAVLMWPQGGREAARGLNELTFVVSSRRSRTRRLAADRPMLRSMRFVALLWRGLLWRALTAASPRRATLRPIRRRRRRARRLQRGWFGFATGAPDAAPPPTCQPVPTACTSNPSCGCLGPALCGGVDSCTYDELAGYVVVQCN